MNSVVDGVETITEFDCPWCHCKIPVEYIPISTRLCTIGKSDHVLVCVSCEEEYNLKVVQAMQDRLTLERAESLGVTTKVYKAMQDEQAYYRKYDEDNVDDEVDVMDADKAKRVFRDNRDPHEQGKKPIEIMKERFEAGLRKERERKIVVPMRSKIIKGRR